MKKGRQEAYMDDGCGAELGVVLAGGKHTMESACLLAAREEDFML